MAQTLKCHEVWLQLEVEALRFYYVCILPTYYLEMSPKPTLTIYKMIQLKKELCRNFDVVKFDRDRVIRGITLMKK